MNNPVTFTDSADDEEAIFAVESFINNAESELSITSSPFAWTPAIPSPSPFDLSANTLRLVPRIPIRLDVANDSDPKKVNARLIRASQMISEILNDLTANGYLYKSANGWAIMQSPRQVSSADSFIGELFINTSTNRLAYKNADGSVTNY